ncbi:MAG TPA: tetratricopeptide repeat protein [Bacteroidota bacterium]|nr:tetratricopeptide repeat protein [Bacteroidota bacterium]
MSKPDNPIHRILLLVGCLVVLTCPIAFSQNRPSDIKYQLGQSYERAGDFESAVRLYQEAFASDSSNMLLFDALRRSYVQLKQYDNAITLVERILRRNPNDIGNLAQLGSLYVLKSDFPRATEIWQHAVSLAPKLEETYRMVAGAMVQSRLFDSAIATYRKARRALGNENIFGYDIAYLYTVTLNYADATREFVNLIRQNPAQLSFIQSRIASYTDRAEGLTAATQVVQDATKNTPDNLAFHQLLAWLYMEAKSYDRAYTVYKFIDEKTHAGGHELFVFAQRALKEQAYQAAATAFHDVLDRYPNIDIGAQVKFGYAQTLEQEEAQRDTLRLFGEQNPFPAVADSGVKPQLTDAVDAYQRVIREYPTTDAAARALLRIASLREDRLFDLNAARTALQSLIASYPQYPNLVLEGKIELANVLVMMGNLDDARTGLQALAGTGPALTSQQERASLGIAEIDYFQGRFADALTLLKPLASNANSDAANDAIAMQIFIQENRAPADSALRIYATAELLEREHKLSEALAQFREVIRHFPESSLIDDAMLSIGDIQTHMGSYEEAVSSYDSLMSKFPESIMYDRTLMKLAQVYTFGLHDKVKAIGTYQALLEKFPDSIYANEARKRVRALRGDTI